MWPFAELVKPIIKLDFTGLQIIGYGKPLLSNKFNLYNPITEGKINKSLLCMDVNNLGH